MILQFPIFEIIGIIVIMGLLFAFALYGFIQFITKKQYQIAYVDKYKQILEVSKMNCPNCNSNLEHFSGLEYIPEYYYCPKCIDVAYNEDGEKIADLE